jgi:hypothetical protein
VKKTMLKSLGIIMHSIVDIVTILVTVEGVQGSCEHGNEPSGSITCWEVLE